MTIESSPSKENHYKATFSIVEKRQHTLKLYREITCGTPSLSWHTTRLGFSKWSCGSSVRGPLRGHQHGLIQPVILNSTCSSCGGTVGGGAGHTSDFSTPLCPSLLDDWCVELTYEYFCLFHSQTHTRAKPLSWSQKEIHKAKRVVAAAERECSRGCGLGSAFCFTHPPRRTLPENRHCEPINGCNTCGT